MDGGAEVNGSDGGDTLVVEAFSACPDPERGTPAATAIESCGGMCRDRCALRIVGSGADGADGDVDVATSLATAAAPSRRAFSLSFFSARSLFSSASLTNLSSSKSAGALAVLSTSLTYAKHSRASLFLLSISGPSPLCSKASTVHPRACPSFLFNAWSSLISRSISKRVRGSQGGRSSVVRVTN